MTQQVMKQLNLLPVPTFTICAKAEQRKAATMANY